MESPPVLVSDDHIERWKQSAYIIRTSSLVLSRMVDPKPSSALAHADSIYHWEKASAWARSYLDAGREHLSLWADLVSPYKFDEDAVNHVAYRPYLLLARSGLESAAHALWLLDVESSDECVDRHIRMMHRDADYFIKARKAGKMSYDKLSDRRSQLVERATQVAPDVRPKEQPPRYEALVRYSAEVQGKDADRWAYLWNAASGAGHGQNWFSLEGYELQLGEEYEPGHHRVERSPDVTFITDTVDAAAGTLQYGALRWALLAGYPFQEMFGQALLEVHARMPKLDGSERHAASGRLSKRLRRWCAKVRLEVARRGHAEGTI